MMSFKIMKYMNSVKSKKNAMINSRCAAVKKIDGKETTKLLSFAPLCSNNSFILFIGIDSYKLLDNFPYFSVLHKFS